MSTNDYTIDVKNLDMNFGKFPALRNFSLRIPKGSAMALLGENGAGKTTTLRILANIYQTTSGNGTVLGYPLGTTDTAFFQRLGYVSENQQLPLSWTLKRYIDYLKPLYSNWDDAFCNELIDDFELPLNRRIGAMSRGMQMKVALVSSLSYRPELLLLDEPFSGLDPLVREELIDGILELMDGGKWTILLSSHDIHEVERLCDSVTLIEHGQAVFSEGLDSLQTRFRKWTIQSNKKPAIPASAILTEQLTATSWSFVDTQHDPNSPPGTQTGLHPSTAVLDSQELSLRDIYLSLAREKKRQRRQRKKSTTA